MAKSDGKERLTVTDAKPMIPTNNSSNMTEKNTCNDADGDDDEDIDDTDQSLTEVLDPELRPEPPIPDNNESQAIYREHRRLAKEYLRVDTKLYYAQDFKDKLVIQMDPAERQEKQELLKKMSEKEELLELYNNLKQQIEKLNSEAKDVVPAIATTAAAPIPRQSSQNDIVADDGWVVIQSNQQNT